MANLTDLRTPITADGKWDSRFGVSLVGWMQAPAVREVLSQSRAVFAAFDAVWRSPETLHLTVFGFAIEAGPYAPSKLATLAEWLVESATAFPKEPILAMPLAVVLREGSIGLELSIDPQVSTCLCDLALSAERQTGVSVLCSWATRRPHVTLGYLASTGVSRMFPAPPSAVVRLEEAVRLEELGLVAFETLELLEIVELATIRLAAVPERGNTTLRLRRRCGVSPCVFARDRAATGDSSIRNKGERYVHAISQVREE
ncbi:MAG: hypothetical protein HY899_09220 [Deltaproteobacteria bacterium]|nr:hypothetical protein [Deltaproteobacteria bacterium]